ncbi:kunitz-like toxin PcKuz3 [Anolis carolinensis]|uniref:kunitz-like toxin PcKuz3 n=1 Tax=Anolis carolinensis TaxID=28377 RepID=UPI002F2B73A8
MPRFYFDIKSGQCEKFIYGGCGGNANNFLTRDECFSKCGGESSSSFICRLPPYVGFCYAAMPRFYFDIKSGQCEKFIYGGCGGNANNFLTQDECLSKCGGCW